MGKMTGNVSDPFCEIFMQDFRNNSHTTVAEFKVRASQAHALHPLARSDARCPQRVGRTELVKNKLSCKFKRSVIVE